MIPGWLGGGIGRCLMGEAEDGFWVGNGIEWNGMEWRIVWRELCCREGGVKRLSRPRLVEDKADGRMDDFGKQAATWAKTRSCRSGVGSQRVRRRSQWPGHCGGVQSRRPSPIQVSMTGMWKERVRGKTAMLPCWRCCHALMLAYCHIAVWQVASWSVGQVARWQYCRVATCPYPQGHPLRSPGGHTEEACPGL